MSTGCCTSRPRTSRSIPTGAIGSVFGRAVERAANPWQSGWWRYRVPGLGEIDWRRLVDALYEGGFDGFVSVEHEDPVWSGSQDLVRDGLTIARRTLSPLLVS